MKLIDELAGYAIGPAKINKKEGWVTTAVLTLPIKYEGKVILASMEYSEPHTKSYGDFGMKSGFSSEEGHTLKFYVHSDARRNLDDEEHSFKDGDGFAIAKTFEGGFGKGDVKKLLERAGHCPNEPIDDIGIGEKFFKVAVYEYTEATLKNFKDNVWKKDAPKEFVPKVYLRRGDSFEDAKRQMELGANDYFERQTVLFFYEEQKWEDGVKTRTYELKMSLAEGPRNMQTLESFSTRKHECIAGYETRFSVWEVCSDSQTRFFRECRKGTFSTHYGKIQKATQGQSLEKSGENFHEVWNVKAVAFPPKKVEPRLDVPASTPSTPSAAPKAAPKPPKKKKPKSSSLEGLDLSGLFNLGR